MLRSVSLSFLPVDTLATSSIPTLCNNRERVPFIAGDLPSVDSRRSTTTLDIHNPDNRLTVKWVDTSAVSARTSTLAFFIAGVTKMVKFFSSRYRTDHVCIDNSMSPEKPSFSVLPCSDSPDESVPLIAYVSIPKPAFRFFFHREIFLCSLPLTLWNRAVSNFLSSDDYLSDGSHGFIVTGLVA